MEGTCGCILQMSMQWASQNLKDDLVILCVGVRRLQHMGSDVNPVTAIFQEPHLRRGVQACDPGCRFVQLVHLSHQGDIAQGPSLPVLLCAPIVQQWLTPQPTDYLESSSVAFC